MSQSLPKIENLEELMEPQLNGWKIESYSTRYLTKPGDNYGSIMLAITTKIKNPNNNQVKNLEVIGKIPPTNELYWKIFKPERSCLTENSIYVTVAPAFEKFQIEAGVPPENRLDVFPKCYGARQSLDLSAGNENVDKHALLIQENLLVDNYRLVSRFEGLDLKHTILTLKNLAQFHAVPIAYRKKYPDEFHKKILKYLQHFNINANLDLDEFKSFTDNAVKCIKKLDIYTEELEKKMLDNIALGTAYMGNPNACPDELFKTIAHYDFWINNMLFKYDENNNPLKIKIVDYQISQYQSLMHDVLFFLFSSVQTNVLRDNYEKFLKLYYDEFIATLKLMKCTTDEYSYELFMNEIKLIAPIQFSHVLFMLKVVMMTQEALPDDFAEMDMAVMEREDSVDENYFNKLRDFIVLYQNFGYF